MKKNIFLSIMILFVNIILLSGQTDKDIKVFSDKKSSTITYSMSHPLHDWSGVSSDFKSVIVTDENKNVIKQVAVNVKISSFDSKNANRDSHCIEVTEALKYPDITFVSSDIKEDGDKLQVSGVLTFHNVKKNISFKAEKTKSKDGKLNVVGGFDVKLTDFDIEPPSLMGIETKDNIKLDFNVVY
ncbi:MAG: YceI family protein [Saprospiraceae bacterium]